MKQYSWIILALIAVNRALFGQQETPKQLSEERLRCLRMDQIDTTDTLAIPLDDDAYEQCMEEEMLEKGYTKK